MKVNKLTKLGLLTCLALIIFVVELRLPDVVPIPGCIAGLFTGLGAQLVTARLNSRRKTRT